MKITILSLLLFVSLSGLFALLEVDIPFDPDIIGQDYSVTGPYLYESDWMTITNIGTTSETYTLFFSDENVPENWYLGVCLSTGTCFTANFAAPFTLGPNDFIEIHISISVASTGGFPFSIVLDEGDLPEPIILDFTFNTEDNLGTGVELLPTPKLGQNYPNPFNPSTTICLNLTTQEAKKAILSIFNAKGQLVKAFSNISSEVVWNGLDKKEKPVNSGIYFYQLKIDDQSYTKKMILLK
jgi:hypothetical protein